VNLGAQWLEWQTLPLHKQLLQEFWCCVQEAQLQKVPLLVLANKQDLPGALEPSAIAEGLNLFSVRDRAWQIEGCSALRGIGIEHGMNWVVQQISG
jgi:ADP-ribosylation factor-like protein 3